MPTPDTKLLQGTLDMLILKALSLAPLHGYGIGQRIMQMSEDVLRVEEGSLYPALYRVERQGWITAEWGVSENNLRARFYKLTRAGRKQLEIEEENWERLARAVFKVSNLLKGTATDVLVEADLYAALRTAAQGPCRAGDGGRDALSPAKCEPGRTSSAGWAG